MTSNPTPNPPRITSATVPKLALSYAEAADALALCQRTVEELVAVGKLPVVRVGRRVLLPVAGLQAWLEKEAE